VGARPVAPLLLPQESGGTCPCSGSPPWSSRRGCCCGCTGPTYSYSKPGSTEMD